MSRYGYPPSHRDHRRPQPEVCFVCGTLMEGESLQTQTDVDGLNGARVCRLHSARNQPTSVDRRRLIPRIQTFVGQARVYEPGDAFWYRTDPFETIKSVLASGDVLLVADDLGATPSTWTDRKSGLIFTASGDPTSATDSAINDLRAAIFDGAGDLFLSSGTAFDPTSGLTATVVVSPDVAIPSAAETVLSQADGTGTGRSWLNTPPDAAWRSALGNVATDGGIKATSYEVVSVRLTAGGVMTIYNQGAETGGNLVTPEAADGEIYVGSSNTGVANFFTGRIAAVVLAASALSSSSLSMITGSLKTYYGLDP